MDRFAKFGIKVSKNNTKQCFILKCDVRKFFASIDHQTLKEILEYNKLDQNTIWLLGRVIDSFRTSTPYLSNSNSIYAMADMKKGLPLGNLTSQLLVNIYMNEFDQYVKHRLKVKYYIRYADDFVILSNNKAELRNLLQYTVVNLKDRLKLDLHPNKVHIKTLSSGVDFLGWVHFPNHRVLRTTTKRRMFRNLQNNSSKATVQSYLGLMSHGETYKLRNKVLQY